MDAQNHISGDWPQSQSVQPIQELIKVVDQFFDVAGIADHAKVITDLMDGFFANCADGDNIALANYDDKYLSDLVYRGNLLVRFLIQLNEARAKVVQGPDCRGGINN